MTSSDRRSSVAILGPLVTGSQTGLDISWFCDESIESGKAQQAHTMWFRYNEEVTVHLEMAIQASEITSIPVEKLYAPSRRHLQQLDAKA